MTGNCWPERGWRPGFALRLRSRRPRAIPRPSVRSNSLVSWPYLACPGPAVARGRSSVKGRELRLARPNRPGRARPAALRSLFETNRILNEKALAPRARNLYKRAIRARLCARDLRCDRPGRHPGSAALETMRLASAGRRFKDIPMSITAERKSALINQYGVKVGDTGSPEVQVAILDRTHRQPDQPLQNSCQRQPFPPRPPQDGVAAANASRLCQEAG